MSTEGMRSGAGTAPIAVVLLSGGLDSATSLAIARDMGFRPAALTFRYGQRHLTEIEASRRVAAAFQVQRHEVVEIDLRAFGGSALTSDIAVPKDRVDAEIATGIPVTYVPARNTIMLSFALAFAEVLGSCDIFVGVNAVDYSGYPDCRPDYIAAFQAMANLATKAAVADGRALTIHTPLIHLTKAEIIRRGLSLGVDYSITSTCYDPTPQGHACGHCDACRLRLKGFAEAGLADPAPYAHLSTG
jgi:7-cyano-7-deazaguanine synthase